MPRPLSRQKRRQRGATLVEFAVVGFTIVLPLIFAIVFTTQLLWIWHSVAEMTRQGARYAATHCYQSGSNVRNWMQQNFIALPDRDQFTGGAAEIQITYYGRNPDDGTLGDFSCDTECSLGCVPDAVRVQITNYEYRTFLTYWGLAPVQIPDFQTTVAMEGAGCDPDTGSCNP